MSWFEDVLKCVCNAANSGQWIVTAVFKIKDLFPAWHFFSHGSDDQKHFFGSWIFLI